MSGKTDSCTGQFIIDWLNITTLASHRYVFKISRQRANLSVHSREKSMKNYGRLWSGRLTEHVLGTGRFGFFYFKSTGHQLKVILMIMAQG